MRITHNTRELHFRKPFGALATDQHVELRLLLEGDALAVDFVLLHYAYGLGEFAKGCVMMLRSEPSGETLSGGGDPSRTSVAPDAEYFYARLRTPDEACLLFYWFQLRFQDHSDVYVYTNPAQPGTASWGAVPPTFTAEADHSLYPFQITVYEADFRVPDWYAGQIMYQIFPDRFARDQHFKYYEMVQQHKASERIYHEDWTEEVDIQGKPETGYIACDFYGGNLKGIEEKLDHLEKLGVSVLYLNPIFEARSNHRYDTADYLAVDPILGSLDDFQALAKAAEKKGIGIVLDGVFSHTGADSLYFNKYGRFPGLGAYRAALRKAPSRHYGWYNIRLEDGSVHYDSWWGFPELPAVNENDLSFREYILGQEGVVASWLKRGAKGFRLDVSDELPDGFIRSLRRTLKNAKADAIVLGEVWEDASCKVSYGAYRDFIFGNTHDSVMGYPFRDALVAYCSWRIDAPRLRDLLENIRENYPPVAFAANMNLLSSHDVPRFITAVAGQQDPGNRNAQMHLRLDPKQRRYGELQLKLAYAFTLLYPGTPSIYYGDERAMEGYRDPFNRRTFPWQEPEGETELLLAELAAFRNRHRVLQTGQIEWLHCEGRGLSFRRYFMAGKDLLGRPASGPREAYVALNNGPLDWADGRGGQVPAFSIVLEIGAERWQFRSDTVLE